MELLGVAVKVGVAAAEHITELRPDGRVDVASTKSSPPTRSPTSTRRPKSFIRTPLLDERPGRRDRRRGRRRPGRQSGVDVARRPDRRHGQLRLRDPAIRGLPCRSGRRGDARRVRHQRGVGGALGCRSRRRRLAVVRRGAHAAGCDRAALPPDSRMLSSPPDSTTSRTFGRVRREPSPN